MTGGAGFTVIVTFAVVVSCVSVADSCKTYAPAWLNVAVVARLAAFANVTVPGPLTLLHVVVNVLPAGNPSSLAVPLSDALAGNVIVWFAPAFTVGG